MTDSVIQITWLGHSCFLVKSHGFSVVVDPYEDGSVPGLPPLRVEADEVLCSHDHHDHGARETVTLRSGQSSPFRIETMDTWHDDKQGALRGPNRIHILDDGEFRIAHLGDLGCRLTDLEGKKLKDLDVLLIPVGGYYTIDAVQAHELAERLSPRILIPMHYRGEGFGYDSLGTLEEFTGLRKDKRVYDGPTLYVTKKLQPQTAVLRFQAEERGAL